MLTAYVINLDRASTRWSHIEDSFKKTSLHLCRISAIDGNTLVLSLLNFDAKRFRCFHGRIINIYEIACYLSHLKAIQAFLETEEEHALICEDDIFLDSTLDTLLAAALKESSSWNVLRLTGLSEGKAFPLKKLTDDYTLSLQLGRLKGAGAYVLDRKAATAFMKHLLPMWLPWDHAFDREWFLGLTALSVAPFPISQTREHFPSAIQKHSQAKLPAWQRMLTTYPYQAFNELTRYVFRLWTFMIWKMFRGKKQSNREINHKRTQRSI